MADNRESTVVLFSLSPTRCEHMLTLASEYNFIEVRSERAIGLCSFAKTSQNRIFANFRRLMSKFRVSFYRVFKKSAQNNKITLYLGTRDLVISDQTTVKIHGVVYVDPDYLQDKKVRTTIRVFCNRTDEVTLNCCFFADFWSDHVNISLRTRRRRSYGTEILQRSYHVPGTAAPTARKSSPTIFDTITGK